MFALLEMEATLLYRRKGVGMHAEVRRSMRPESPVAPHCYFNRAVQRLLCTLGEEVGRQANLKRSFVHDRHKANDRPNGNRCGRSKC